MSKPVIIIIVAVVVVVVGFMAFFLSPKFRNKSTLPDCKGSWNVRLCNFTGKKIWQDLRKMSTWDEPCKEKIAHGTEADCEPCNGYFGPCRTYMDLNAHFEEEDGPRGLLRKKTWINILTPDCFPMHEDGFAVDCVP